MYVGFRYVGLKDEGFLNDWIPMEPAMAGSIKPAMLAGSIKPGMLAGFMIYVGLRCFLGRKTFISFSSNIRDGRETAKCFFAQHEVARMAKRHRTWEPKIAISNN